MASVEHTASDAGSPPAHLLDQRLTLIDSRTLCYAEFGNASGFPVFYFHGFPGCRLEPWQHHRLLKRLRIRLISPDRPGTGNSTPQPKRRLLDYPSDILELANHLGLGKFGILGVSGGGPYAVTCAKEILANRISVVGLLAPAAPWLIEGQASQEPEGELRIVSRLGAWAVKHVPWLVGAIVGLITGVIAWLVEQKWVIRIIERHLEGSTRDRGAKQEVVCVSNTAKPKLMNLGR